MGHASIYEVHKGRGRWEVQMGMEGLALTEVCEDVNALTLHILIARHSP